MRPCPSLLVLSRRCRTTADPTPTTSSPPTELFPSAALQPETARLVPSPIFIGSLDLVASDPHIWTFDDLSSIPLPDGEYSLIITNGTGAASLDDPLDSQDFVIDNTAPEITIDAVEGDDVLTAPESENGLQVSPDSLSSELALSHLGAARPTRDSV